MILLESTAVHIPLFDQCCFFNVSASCLWVEVFFFNLTGQTSLSLTLTPFFILASAHTVSYFFFGGGVDLF